MRELKTRSWKGKSGIVGKEKRLGHIFNLRLEAEGIQRRIRCRRQYG